MPTTIDNIEIFLSTSILGLPTTINLLSQESAKKRVPITSACVMTGTDSVERLVLTLTSVKRKLLVAMGNVPILLARTRKSDSLGVLMLF